MSFLLTRLMRGAAQQRPKFKRGGEFLLTRLMRGAANLERGQTALYAISTHAPHARRGQKDPRNHPYR